ncbi:MAG TPA: glycosyltransferase [Nitrospiraceae bacterium]|nr:glycosyltransferase [Nitrospiraceae bacterium]
MERVSVIVPVFNAERFLAKTIESVLSQTYADIELIVVDDGSTDGSARILADYQDHICVIRQANAGQSAARNTGARIAKGRYLAFLDSDDIWYPEKLSREVKVFDERPHAVLVHSEVDWMDEGGAVYRRGMTQQQRARDRSRLTHITGLDVSFILPSAMVVRRESFEEVGGFDTALHSGEDLDLPIRLRMLGEIVLVADSGLCYRIHPASLTRSGGDIRYASGERLCRKLAARFTHDREKTLQLDALFAEHYRMWAFEYFQKGHLRKAGQLWIRAAVHGLRGFVRRLPAKTRPGTTPTHSIEHHRCERRQ